MDSKAKPYDWKDSNLALYGSDEHKKVSKDSADTEPAWKNAGTKVGKQIWRIEQFKVVAVAPEEYGYFYNGDSYIVMNTYIKPGEQDLEYDIHFWIGEESTQDEYGTAAYKTVELDTFLNDKPIQHREVQGYESQLFKSYFPNMIIMQGGTASGFNKVKPEDYKPRLLHIYAPNKNTCTASEVHLCKENVSKDDVMILDYGNHGFVLQGATCNANEKYKSMQITSQIKSERRGKFKFETLDQDEWEKHECYLNLPNGSRDECDKKKVEVETALIKVSDESGKLKSTEVAKGKVDKSLLDDNDVFLLVHNNGAFCWVGSKASIDERHNAMSYAHNYLMNSSTPFLPVTVLQSGKENADFNGCF